MSEANVELVRGLLTESDLGKDEILAMLPSVVAHAFDPGVEWVEAPERADGRVWRGHQGILDSWTRWLEDFEDYRVEALTIEDHGDRGFVAAREHARGLASGATTTAEIFSVFTIRDGRIVRYEEFYDEARARARLRPSDS